MDKLSYALRAFEAPTGSSLSYRNNSAGGGNDAQEDIWQKDFQDPQFNSHFGQFVKVHKYIFGWTVNQCKL